MMALLLPSSALAKKSRFEKGSVRLEIGPRMTYYVYTPEEMAPEGLPLVVYIHGSGESGDRALTAGLPALIQKDAIASFPAVLLVPQMPRTNWAYLRNQVMAMVEKVAEEYQTDPDRLTLAGFSMGATYGWGMIELYPEFFTRFASVCGRMEQEEELLEPFAGTYVRTYVGTRDTNVPPKSSMKFTQKLMDAGYPAELFAIDATHQQMQKNAFLDQDLLDFLTWTEPTAEETAENE
ncbi:MAG: dienelactone hydrolase family protein [Clostridia bacterium]|nr:dienelactone hydrolase family protein [Clostridia bacterium]